MLSSFLQHYLWPVFITIFSYNFPILETKYMKLSNVNDYHNQKGNCEITTLSITSRNQTIHKVKKFTYFKSANINPRISHKQYQTATNKSWNYYSFQPTRKHQLYNYHYINWPANITDNFKITTTFNQTANINSKITTIFNHPTNSYQKQML